MLQGYKAGRVLEWAKTVLIVGLTISALLLGWQTGLFTEFVAGIPFFGSVAEMIRGTASPVETGETPVKEAARPLSIVITNEEGLRYGVRYDTDARNAVYDRASSIIGEALGSAFEPVEIDEDEWRSALSGAGVFFEYVTPVKLSVLDGWLGARIPEMPEDILLRRLYVAFGEERSRIYLQDFESGSFFGADTASAAGKAQELEIYSPNGAVFAYETGIRGSENAPYMLIMQESDHSEIRAAPAGSTTDVLNIVLTSLGHGSDTYTMQPDGSTAVRFVGIQFSVRADIHGNIFYRRTDGLPPIEERKRLSESEMIERARSVVADIIGGDISGDAEVFFESAEYEQSGSGSVYFGYYIAGGRISLQNDAHAAKVTFTYGAVTEVELVFRHFSYTGEYTGLLPERQAIAAAGGEFMLCYSDTGHDVLRPFWVKYIF